MNKCLLGFLILVSGSIVQANDSLHTQQSKYMGQEKRTIKSLSPDDIAELKRGGGWGLAKAAELNGVPGPVHLLELKQEIQLDSPQILKITKIYKQMKVRAIDQGEKLIILEQALEKHFQDRTITDEILHNALDAIAKARKSLRYIHLSTHLKMLDILSQNQIDSYNALRGYANPNPCDSIPEGHNAEMWRKHNGCKLLPNYRNDGTEY